MSNKTKTKNKKCITCENYSKKDNKCKLNKDCNTDFSKCTDYLINDKLVNF